MNGKRTLVIALAALSLAAGTARAAALRQYYSPWAYHPSRAYFYRTYYYKPHAGYTGYDYHYAIYYPAEPRYVYFYNPYKRFYWGRYDTQGKAGQEYSLLAQEDRREKRNDIPESAFRKVGRMPPIPDSTDGESIEPPKDLPKGEK